MFKQVWTSPYQTANKLNFPRYSLKRGLQKTYSDLDLERAIPRQTPKIKTMEFDLLNGCYFKLKTKVVNDPRLKLKAKREITTMSRHGILNINVAI